MADVIERGGDRAQLFLVTALTLAVLFVALAVLLNTAIYTENIATRESETAGTDVLQRQQAVATAGAIIVDGENYGGTPTYSAMRSNVTSGLGNWSDAAALQDSFAGQTSNVSLVTLYRGTRIAQNNSSRDLTAGGDQDGDDEWQLADDVRARNVTVRVKPNSLDNQSGAFLDLDETFNVLLDASSDRRVYIYDYDVDGDGDDVDDDVVEVYVERPGGDEICNYDYTDPSDPVTVDFTEGRIGDQSCDALTVFEEPSGDYDVWYDDGDEAVGTYSLLVDAENGTVRSDPYEPTPSGDSPFKRAAVYGLDLEMTYVSPELTVRTELGVVPGETDD
jgi:hypothetical protein